MNDSPNYYGFLNLLKPPGMTSARAVGIVKKLLKGAKIGHAGTLDPEASGVLPLMIGKATRLFDLLQNKEKEYISEIAFGSETDTQDAQGKLIASDCNYPSMEMIRAILPRFTGTQLQRPPMYSALSQNGERLYDLARKGKYIEIPERVVFVKDLQVLHEAPFHGVFIRVKCSKGFYVRTLCTDIGRALQCPSHMRFLLRTQSGPFTIEKAVTIEELTRATEENRIQSLLMTPMEVFPDLPIVIVPSQLEKVVRNGGLLHCKQFSKLNRIPDSEDSMFGLVMNESLCAIAKRNGERILITTWLGE